MTLLVLFVVLAIGVSFICSLLEAALLSMTPSYVETLEADRPKLAASLRGLREDIDRPLAAILSLNTIAHTVGATGAGAQAEEVFGSVGVGIFSAVLTLGILVLSEIVPKTIGATYWRGLTPFVVRTLPFLILIQWPLVKMSQFLTGLLTRGSIHGEVSREEIAALTTAGQRLGVVEEDEGRIVRNLFQLGTITVDAIMTPRTVIEALDETATIDEAVRGRDGFPYSRLPLARGSLDEVDGFVLTRDLLLAALKGEGERPVSSLARELPRIPGTMDLDALFDFFTGTHAAETADGLKRREEAVRHIALVEDEFGGTAGIVTLEDAVETLLGLEIVDEQDRAADMQARARELAAERRKGRAAIPADAPGAVPAEARDPKG